ncbi:MAG TPA: MFS transporter [Actinocrinis sp.]|nr:MFS transporter [Actinocrinis sp.]
MTHTAPARAGRREWIALGVLTLTALMVSMDTMVLYFAVPFISAKLQPSASQQLWILDVYGFVLAGLLITMGSLGDRIGRRLLLLAGGAAFGLASLAAAYSHSADQLIASRALLGIAGATIAPSTMALLRNMFEDPKERKTAIGVWTGAFSGGAALGPVVGGLLLDHFWWGSVFLVNVPIMLVLLIAGPLLLPEYRAAGAGRFDLVSALLSFGAVLPVVYGVQQWAQNGLSTSVEASIAAGLIVGALFVLRQLRMSDPMIDLGLLRHRTFSAAMLANILAGSMMAGFGLFSTQYLQLVLGYRPLGAALWSLPAPLAVGGAVAVATALSRKIRPATVIGSGFLVMTAGFVVMTQVHVHSSVAVVLIGAIALAFGIGMIVALLTDMIIGTAPAERAGAASALSETGNEIGGAVGVAFLGSIGAAVYHHLMSGAAPAAARTLGGAQATAATLPGQTGTDLLEHARQSFVQGMHLAAVVCIVLMVAGAAVSTALLRHVKSDAGRQADRDAQAAADLAGEPGLALAANAG